jgi:hypothetical protein
MTDQVAQIEVTMQQAKDCVIAADALQRLHKNRDFKKIILEGYFKDEPARLVGLKGDANMQDEARQAAIVKEIDGIGTLQQHFRTIYQRAAWAEQALEQGEAELREIEAEAEEAN